MTKKLVLVLAMLLVAFFAFAQKSPSGQGPTILNGGLTSVPGGFPGAGPPNNPLYPGLGRHDLKDATTGNPIGCESCHIPHTAPTWGTAFNWAWTALPVTLYTYYTTLNPSGSLTQPVSGVGPASAVPSGNARSMLCFSCHDGTSATNNGVVGGVTFNGTPYALVTTSTGTGSLGNQHPVDAAVPTTGDYVQPVVSSGLYGSDHTIGTQSLPMWNNRVECGTCHDVHNDYTTSGGGLGTGGIPFLRQDNTYGTVLCRQCHNAQ